MYSFAVIPTVGQLVTGDRESYQYLVESIRKFPPQVMHAAAALSAVQYAAQCGCVSSAWQAFNAALSAVHRAPHGQGVVMCSEWMSLVISLQQTSSCACSQSACRGK